MQYLYINQENKGLVSSLLSQLALSISFVNLFYVSTVIMNSVIILVRPQTSDSDETSDSDF